MPSIDELLTVAQAAEQFKITEQRIYRWLDGKPKRLTTYRRKFDNVKMVDPAEVQRVIDSLTQVEKEEEV